MLPVAYRDTVWISPIINQPLLVQPHYLSPQPRAGTTRQMTIQRVFTGRNVVLGDGQPQPATVIVDVTEGRILDVLNSVSVRSSHPDIPDEHWIDVDDKYLIPGIVE